MNAGPKTVALLIDGDNPPLKYTEQIIQFCKSHGTLSIKKAYGDWNQPPLSSHRKTITGHGIEDVQQNRVGKNATDFRLAVDVGSMLAEGAADIYIIVSNDGDFTTVCEQIRQKGAKVIGIGSKGKDRKGKASSTLRQACNAHFYYVEDIVIAQSNAAAAPQPRPPAKDAIKQQPNKPAPKSAAVPQPKPEAKQAVKQQPSKPAPKAVAAPQPKPEAKQAVKQQPSKPAPKAAAAPQPKPPAKEAIKQQPSKPAPKAAATPQPKPPAKDAIKQQPSKPAPKAVAAPQPKPEAKQALKQQPSKPAPKAAAAPQPKPPTILDLLIQAYRNTAQTNGSANLSQFSQEFRKLNKEIGEIFANKRPSTWLEDFPAKFEVEGQLVRMK